MAGCWSCGTALTGQYCSSCGASQNTRTGWAPAPPKEEGEPWYRWRTTWAAALIVVLVVAYWAAQTYDLWPKAPAGSDTADPLAGKVVFGDSFDSDFEIASPRTTAKVGETTAWVAHADRVYPKGQPVIARYLFNGSEVTSQSDPIDMDWAVLGNTLPGSMLTQPGTWRIEIRTVGNELIASGTLTVK